MKLVAVLLICLPLASSSCDFPPSLWCSSGEIAKSCNVYEQCMESSLKVYGAGPVSLELYYESLCPDCKEFMTQQLYKTWKLLGPDVLNITLYPYGNAHEMKTPFGGWKFTCQHGPEECTGNLIQACAINLLKNFTSYFEFIHCMEASDSMPEKSSDKCAQKFGIDMAPIKSCASGKIGNTLEHGYALKTEVLIPPHKYVPWLVINGVHTEKMNDKATSDLLSLICDMYKGPTPQGCRKVKKCIRD